MKALITELKAKRDALPRTLVHSEARAKLSRLISRAEALQNDLAKVAA